MISIQRCTSADPRFQTLVGELDADLLVRYGAKQSEYDVHNKGLADARVVIAMNEGAAVGCACFKPLDAETIEIKRMYVQPGIRRLGVAQHILAGLEQWGREEGYRIAKLQTAIKQPEAIALYQKVGYRPTPAYGPYVDDADSVCLEKDI